MSRTSEPLSFGIDEGQAPEFLAARGFQNVVDVGAQELASRYFDPRGKHCIHQTVVEDHLARWASALFYVVNINVDHE